VQDVLLGSVRQSLTSCSVWLAVQAECADPLCTHAHLVQGTRSSRKTTNVNVVKMYLDVATIASDGLLIFKHSEAFMPVCKCIIIPCQVLDGLLTALHIQLNHPTSHQLKNIVKRYLYALDMDKAVDRVTSGYHSCAALCQTPTVQQEQTTSTPPEAVG